ncbi:hypothetical protein RUM43_006881, partial [Polyplax serrata]
EKERVKSNVNYIPIKSINSKADVNASFLQIADKTGNVRTDRPNDSRRDSSDSSDSSDSFTE